MSDAEPHPALRDRRHHPPGGQQPGGLHHAGRTGPLVALLHRPRQDDIRPRDPRERRLPRGGVQGDAARIRLSEAVPQGDLRRLELLQEMGTQRAGRSDVYEPVPVQHHQESGVSVVVPSCPRAPRVVVLLLLLLLFQPGPARHANRVINLFSCDTMLQTVQLFC